MTADCYRAARAAIRLCIEEVVATCNSLDRRARIAHAEDNGPEAERLDTLARGALVVWARLDPAKQDEIAAKAIEGCRVRVPLEQPR